MRRSQKHRVRHTSGDDATDPVRVVDGIRVTYKNMAKVPLDAVDRQRACSVNPKALSCTQPAGSMNQQVRNVLGMMMSAQQNGFRSLEAARQKDRDNVIRRERVRCMSLQQEANSRANDK